MHRLWRLFGSLPGRRDFRGVEISKKLPSPEDGSFLYPLHLAGAYPALPLASETSPGLAGIRINHGNDSLFSEVCKIMCNMIDELWPGGPQFKDEAGVFRLGTDSVLLAHFVKGSQLTRKKRAVDLGCGAGIISIIMAWDDPGLTIDGVEIQHRAASLAMDNAKLCGLAQRVNVVENDIRRHRELFSAGYYDLAVSNPPYYSCGSGMLSANAEIKNARAEELCTLDDICQAAGYLTRWGGSFVLVHKPERLAEIFRELAICGFEPKRMRFAHHKRTSPPSLVLIESRRGGKPSLKIEAPLILTNDDGSDSPEVRAIYRRGVK